MSFKISKVEKLPDNKAEIIGELSLDVIKECRSEAIKNFNNSIDLPGFRKGQVPENVLIKTVGEMRILEETAEIALAREYPHIIEEAKLRPLMRPQISVTKMAPEIPLEFKIHLVLEPEFDLPDYKAIAGKVEEDDKEKKRLKIIDELVKATKINLPTKFVEGEIHHTLHHFKHDLEKAGVAFEKYLEQINKTEDEVKDTWREQIESRAKTELILSKIAEKENLKTYREVFDLLEKRD